MFFSSLFPLASANPSQPLLGGIKIDFLHCTALHRAINTASSRGYKLKIKKKKIEAFSPAKLRI